MVLLSDSTQPARDRLSGLIDLAVLLCDQRMWELSHDVFNDALSVSAELDGSAVMSSPSSGPTSITTVHSPWHRQSMNSLPPSICVI